MRSKKGKIKNNNYFTVITMMIVLSVLGLSIGWSAFQSTLLVTSTVAVRVNSDIRITDFSYESATNGATYTSNMHNLDFISANIDLPSSNSTITFKVDVTNIELNQDEQMGIFDITGLHYRLKILNITGYDLKTSICDNSDPTDCGTGAQRTFYIEIGYGEDNNHNSLYDSSNTTYDISLDIDFREMYKVTYMGFTNTPTKTRIIDGDTPTISLAGDSPSNITVANVGSTLTLGTDYTYSNYNLTFINPVTSNITITSNNIVNYTITYVLNDGTQATGQVTTFNSNTNQTILDPTRTDYLFAGWYTDSGFTSSKITNTSQLSGNTTLYAKWYMLLRAKIESLNGATNPNDCENAFATDDPDSNLRFIGGNPCNYIDIEGDTWRIIGIFNMTKSNNATENLIKLVKPTPTVTSTNWDTSSSNYFENASVNTYLNTTYYGTLSTAQKAYIEQVYWNLGGASSTSTPATSYSAERGSTAINGLTRYLANVGLFYPSDYGFAVASSNRSKCMSSSMGNFNKQCTGNNWLYDSSNASYNQWTLMPRTGSTTQSFRLNNNGKVAAATCNSNGSVRPTIYLKGTVVYDHDYSARTGSSSSPFKAKVIS